MGTGKLLVSLVEYLGQLRHLNAVSLGYKALLEVVLDIREAIELGLVGIKGWTQALWRAIILHNALLDLVVGQIFEDSECPGPNLQQGHSTSP